MVEVIPGIYQIKLPLPTPDILLGYINTYLIQGNNEYLLIDTGWDTEEALNSLERQLAEIGAGFRDISHIVLTHIHPDHYGLAGRLKQLSQAKLALHYREKDLIESRYVDMNSLLQQMAHWLYTNGVATNELPELQTASLGVRKFVTPVFPDITLHGNEVISIGSFNFKVLWTPGHSPGHISLYEPTQRLLISGDQILPTITPNIGLHPQSDSNPLGDYLNSLNQLSQLDINLVLPGHENPFTGLKQRIKELMWHHERRKSEILEIMKDESRTGYQIATEVTWVTDIIANGVAWMSLTPLDKRLAIMETLAHLELMRFNGKIDKFSKNSTIYYKRI
jgi:glyoxylase-like metal-dependent hydrolase (beta-lactamase superfamily II)